jgi:hypothetical protein
MHVAGTAPKVQQWCVGVQVQAVRSSFEGAMLEALVECYAHGTYSKVPEFLAFQRRALQSRTYIEANAEHVLLLLRVAVLDGLLSSTRLGPAADAVRRHVQATLQDCSESLAALAESSLDSCFVNEDLSLLPRWLPPHAGIRCAPRARLRRMHA